MNRHLYILTMCLAAAGCDRELHLGGALDGSSVDGGADVDGGEPPCSGPTCEQDALYALPDLGPVPPEVCLFIANTDAVWYRMNDGEEWARLARGGPHIIATRGPTMDVALLSERTKHMIFGIPVQLMVCEDSDHREPDMQQPIEVIGAREGFSLMIGTSTGFYERGNELPPTVPAFAGEPLSLSIVESQSRDPRTGDRVFWTRGLSPSPTRSVRADLAHAFGVEELSVVGIDGIQIIEASWWWQVDELWGVASGTFLSERPWVPYPVSNDPGFTLTASIQGTAHHAASDRNFEIKTTLQRRGAEIGTSLDYRLGGIVPPDLAFAVNGEAISVRVVDPSPPSYEGISYRKNSVELQQEATDTFLFIERYGGPITEFDIQDWVPMSPEHAISYRVHSTTTSRIEGLFSFPFRSGPIRIPVSEPSSSQEVHLTVRGEWRASL